MKNERKKKKIIKHIKDLKRNDIENISQHKNEFV